MERLTELLDRIASGTGSIASLLTASEWHELQEETAEMGKLRNEHAVLWDALQAACALVDYWAPKDGVPRTHEWRALLIDTAKDVKS